MVVSSSRSKVHLLLKFLDFCESRDLSEKQIDKEASKYFAFCMAKGWDECVFPEFLSLFVKGKWCPFVGHCQTIKRGNHKNAPLKPNPMNKIHLDWRNIEIECEYEKDGNEVQVTNIKPLGKWDNFDVLVWFDETESPLSEIAELIVKETAEPITADEYDD